MLELFVQVEVEAKIEHLLPPRATSRVRLAYPALVVKFLGHLVKYYAGMAVSNLSHIYILLARFYVAMP